MAPEAIIPKPTRTISISNCVAMYIVAPKPNNGKTGNLPMFSNWCRWLYR